MKKKPTDTCVKCGCARRRHRSARSGIDRTRCRNCQCLAFREMGHLDHDAEGKSYTVGDYQKAARDGDPRTAPPPPPPIPKRSEPAFVPGPGFGEGVPGGGKKSAAPPPVPVCPLAPHIPLASVGVIGAYVVASVETGSPYRVNTKSLLRIAYLERDTTTEKAVKTLGGGSFILVCTGIDNSTPIGESSILLPGERSQMVVDLIAKDRQRRVDELKAASDKQAKETAFSTQLHTDEEELIRHLAEIHHSVLQLRFEAPSVTEAQGVSFQKLLNGSEQGIALLVKRLKARPGVESWWATSAWIMGAGIAAVACYAMAAGAFGTIPKPTAAGVGVGKAP